LDEYNDGKRKRRRKRQEEGEGEFQTNVVMVGNTS
jgi:hypothetical protein